MRLLTSPARALLSIALPLLAVGRAAAAPADPSAPSAPAPASISSPASAAPAGVVTVDTRAASLANSFIPDQTIGAGVDGVAAGHVRGIYTPSNVKQMLTAGDRTVSYRLYTELSVQQWHWNPSGTWSDPRGKRGYFTGAVDSKSPVIDTYGYRLPHRGGTFDQGNNDDYSRIADGDPKTYWKSNPYLSRQYTGEEDTLHPQWIIVDLGSPQPVDAVRIDWANPYATSFIVQTSGAVNPIGAPDKTQWTAFPNGVYNSAQGGLMTLRIAPAPITARYVRVLMIASSGTPAPDESKDDPRSSLGYAVSEIGVGTLDASGSFDDLVVHEPDRKQSNIWASSVDPWHTDADRCKTEEQPGFDALFRSGLTRDLPTMIPVGVLYDTPEDAVAELQFLRNRGYAVSYVEMGEEADEEWMVPEDYAALYCEWAAAIHARFPGLKIGGPVMASHAFTTTWPNAAGDTDWLGRFYAYLQSHNRTQDLAFYSFEFYPDARGGFNGPNLLEDTDAVGQMFDQKHFSHIPDSVPSFLTETNINGFSPEQPDVYGALWHADFLADFLTSGGKGFYFYEYEPLPLGGSPKDGYGSFSMFSSGNDNKIRQPLSQYFSARLINLDWLDPAHPDQRHDLYPATVAGIPPMLNHSVVTAYAVHRPDGQWSVMLINKSATTGYQLALNFLADNGAAANLNGAVRRAQFGPGQYVFHQTGPDSTAGPDGPEAVDTLSANAPTLYGVPAESIVVLTGNTFYHR